VALLQRGRLAGPRIPLARPAGHGFHFFLRFDPVPGLQVRLLTRPSVLDARAVISRRGQPPRPPSPLRDGEPNVLVREIGPDSRLWGVRLAAGAAATVGELRAAVAPLLHCEPKQLALRVRPAHAVGMMMRSEMMLDDDGARLSDVGVRIEPNGAQMSHLYADVPMT
jgi:hypothetical protein